MIRIGQSGRVTSRLANVFALNREGLTVSRGIETLAVLAVPFVVLTALDEEKYLLNATFGVLFVALSDPGGKLAQRLRPMAGVAVGGALLIAFGFALGEGPWEFAVLAAFVVTLLGGLMMRFGIHTFVTASWVNIWFIVALTLPRPSPPPTFPPLPGPRGSRGSPARPYGSRSRSSFGSPGADAPWCHTSPRSPATPGR
jgi:hypothetical protein